MPAALEGLQVIDFTSGLAGAIATMVLGDNGADVIKVEPPDGDPDRELPAFAQWHRGKQSVLLDLATPEGNRRAKALAATADVLVESWRPVSRTASVLATTTGRAQTHASSTAASPVLDRRARSPTPRATTPLLRPSPVS